MTAACLKPASRDRSTLPSVWPARSRTPPSRACSGNRCPLPRTRLPGPERSSMATVTVRARSNAEVPVVMPVRASIGCVNGVAIGSPPAPCGSKPSRLQIACERARQTMPQPLRIMKLIASGVARSAGMMRSPSFSRFSSSTSTIIRPARNSEIASSIEQNIRNSSRFDHCTRRRRMPSDPPGKARRSPVSVEIGLDMKDFHHRVTESTEHRRAAWRARRREWKARRLVTSDSGNRLRFRVRPASFFGSAMLRGGALCSL